MAQHRLCRAAAPARRASCDKALALKKGGRRQPVPFSLTPPSTTHKMLVSPAHPIQLSTPTPPRSTFSPAPATMAAAASPPQLTLSPLPLPPSADPAHFATFGRQVDGVDLETADEATLAQVLLFFPHHLLGSLALTP
jgi:hypothetical protein